MEPANRTGSSWLTDAWQGPRITATAQCLRPLSWLYGGLAASHAALYRLGFFKRQRAPRPLLVVGNLVAGGAGKTPAVMAIVRLLAEQGWTPGVISRGHGRRSDAVLAVRRDSAAQQVGDEPLLIHLRTGVPVVVGRERARAAQALCAAHPDVDILVADDGLQHHRLHHDMAVWVFDDRGAGNGLQLPAGPLRQTMPEQVPPHVRVLYSAGRASTALPGFVGHRRLAGLQPLQDWWTHPQRSLSDTGWASLLEPGRAAIVAAAGLARPEPFFRMLQGLGLTIQPLALPDHHAFDVLPWPEGTARVVVTEKDAVKLSLAAMGSTQVWVARLDFDPEPAFGEALRQLCAPYKT